MLKVFSLVLYLLVQSADTPSVALPLGISKSLFSSPIPTGVLNRLASGECGEEFKSNVNADFLFSGVECSRRNIITGEYSIPLSVFSFECNGFDDALNFAVQLDSHKPDVLDSKFAVELDAIAVGGEGNRIKSVAPFEPRESSLQSRFDSPEEAVIGFLQSPENVLTGGVVQKSDLRKGVPQFFELSGLVVVVERNLPTPPRVTPLLKGEVVKRSTSIKQAVQLLKLTTVRVEPMFERSSHLFSLLLLNVPFDGFFTNGSNCSRIVGTRPERGQTRLERRKFISQFVRCKTFETIRNFSNSPTGVAFQEQVNVVGHNLQRVYRHFQFFTLSSQENFKPFCNTINKNRSPILRAPNKMILEVKDGNSIFSIPVFHHIQYTAVSNQNQVKDTQFLCPP